MTSLGFATHATPFGDALLAFTTEGLVGLQLTEGATEPELERLALRLHAAPEPDDAAGAELAAQLDEYFAGVRRGFDIVLDWRLTAGFARDALHAVLEIPYGETASYGEVAAMAGHPRAHRAVGTACGASPFSLVVPVHRVVRADGSIGDYGGRSAVKRSLLALEREGMSRRT